MYNVLDICRYIVRYCGEHNYPLSNLKLQKILYFIQAFFLSYTPERQPCFREQIQAWDFGPVVPEAYHEYKRYGAGEIPSFSRCFLQNNIHIKEKDINRINSILDELASFTATQLVDITHDQDPWENNYVSRRNNVISIEDMRNYFDRKYRGN